MSLCSYGDEGGEEDEEGFGGGDGGDAAIEFPKPKYLEEEVREGGGICTKMILCRHRMHVYMQCSMHVYMRRKHT